MAVESILANEQEQHTKYKRANERPASQMTKTDIEMNEMEVDVESYTTPKVAFE